MNYESIKNTLEESTNSTYETYRRQCNTKDWVSLQTLLSQQVELNKDLAETIIAIASDLEDFKYECRSQKSKEELNKIIEMSVESLDATQATFRKAGW